MAQPEAQRRSPWLAKFLAALVAVVLVAEVGARLVVATSEAPVLRTHDFSSQLKLKQMSDLRSADTVVVGTSMAQQDLVPQGLGEILGDEVYNAGLNGGVPTVASQWLLDSVVPSLTPSTVIWGLGPLDMSAEYGDATLRAYSEAANSRTGTLASADRFGSKFSALVSSRVVLREPSKIWGDEAAIRAERFNDAQQLTGALGERIDFRVRTDEARRTEMARRVSPFGLDREDLAAVAEAVAKLQAKGITVVFVQLPVPERFVALMPERSSDHELSNAAVAALAAELDVPLVVSDQTFSDVDFVDFTHLSEDAADRFTKEIALKIRELS